MTKPVSYRIKSNDGLPKTMTDRQWVELVLRTRPRTAKVAGLVVIDMGLGPQLALLAWDGNCAFAAPLNDIPAAQAQALAAEAPLIDRYRAQAAAGQFNAALARKQAA